MAWVPVGGQIATLRWGGDPVRLDPLVVEQQVMGSWQNVAWLGHEINVTWPLNELPTALLPVVLHTGFLINDASPEDPGLKPLEQVLYDNEPIRIRTARQGADFMLFEGYLKRVKFDAQGATQASPRASEKTLKLEFVHVADDARSIWIGGQCRPSKADIEAASGNGGRVYAAPRQYSGLDVIFNPNGAGNCDGVRVEVSGLPTGEPEIPLFGEPRAAGVESWSWLRVLVHLAYLARRTADGAIGTFTVHDFKFWNLWQLATSTRMAIDPDTAGSTPSDDPWERILLGKPRGHVIDGLDWLDAWNWTCAQAGLAYVWEPRWDGALPRWGIRLLVPGDSDLVSGANRPLMTWAYLPSPAYTVDDKPWEQIVEQANVIGLHIDKDYGAALNRVRVRGGTLKYEVTTQLLPAWPVDDWWDVDPENAEAVDAAVDRLGSTEWCGRYNIEHALTSSAYWRSGRFWGLNMCGDLDGYGRDWGPFHKADEEAEPPVEDMYALFDLKDVEVREVQTGPGTFQQGRNAVRRRPFEACVTGRSPFTPQPPVVELSYDSGVNWEGVAAGVRVMRRDARIYFDIQDLSKLVSQRPENGGLSFAAAYIRGTVRVRITAGLRGDVAVGDDAAGGQEHASDSSILQRARFKLLNRRTQLEMSLRDDDQTWSGGNSQFKGSSKPVAGRNDQQQAGRQALEFLRRYDRVVFRGPLHLPAMAFPEPIDAGNPDAWPADPNEPNYRPGDLLAAVAAVDDGSHSLVPIPNHNEAGAVIAAISWAYKADPPAALTTLQLEDTALVVRQGKA